MKKYFLTIISNDNFNNQQVIDIGMTLGEIVDSKCLSFNFSGTVLMFHFESSVNKEDMYTFIQGVLYGISDTFILTDMSDKYSISLPTKMNFLFDLENANSDPNDFDIFVNYDDEDDEDDDVYENIMSNYRQNLKKHEPTVSLDSLLDKINETGINSLSEVEVKILESYSK
jgi:hypothetical protein